MSREGGLIIVGSVYTSILNPFFFWLNVKCAPPFCLIFEQQKKNNKKNPSKNPYGLVRRFKNINRHIYVYLIVKCVF